MDPSLRQSDAPAEGAVAAADERTVEEEPPSRWRLDLELVDDDGDWQALGEIEALVEAVRRVLADAPGLPDAAPSSATIALSSDDAVRRLNANFRSKDAPTNVLSFPTPALPHHGQADGPHQLGDVVLAAETVLAEAAAAGIPPAHHFQHLVIHGLLHLIGYDHETDADAERMESLETTLLARLGIADPHAPSALDAGRPDQADHVPSHPPQKLHRQ